MDKNNIVTVPEAMQETAGAITWWELGGNSIMEDLEDALDAEGLTDDWIKPSAPSLTVALSRAASSALSSKRHLLRPLSKRGHWEIVYEMVFRTPTGTETLRYRTIVQGHVAKENGVETPRIRIVDVDAGPDLKTAILSKLPLYQSTLCVSDISSWLLGIASSSLVSTVSLRQRGGFYFIPKDQLDFWNRVSRALQAASAHRVYGIPAMQTEEAVEAILSSLQREADTAMAEIEDYLAADVSTRGLNSSIRKLSEVKAKVVRYSGLLNVQQPALLDQAEQLTGLVQAALISQQTRDAV